MTAGHNQVPSFLVSDCSQILLSLHLIIFNLSLCTSTLPECWNLTTYYFCCVKKWECNILKELQTYFYNFECCKGLRSFVYRSTISKLLPVSQYISNTLDCQGQVEVIYTDFSKAFDHIDHFILIPKLERFGIVTDITYFVSNKSTASLIYMPPHLEYHNGPIPIHCFFIIH